MSKVDLVRKNVETSPLTRDDFVPADVAINIAHSYDDLVEKLERLCSSFSDKGSVPTSELESIRAASTR